MDLILQQTTEQQNNGRIGFCSRLMASIGPPDRLQPTILAISVIYIAYTISTVTGLFPYQPAVTQFTYYCCILGFVSGVVFYLKYSCNDSHSTLWLLAYESILVLVVLFYIGYWLVKPNNLDEKARNGGLIGGTLKQAQINQTGPVDLSCTVDKLKCSGPLHLVLQSAFMLFILASLIINIFN